MSFVGDFTLPQVAVESVDGSFDTPVVFRGSSSEMRVKGDSFFFRFCAYVV